MSDLTQTIQEFRSNDPIGSVEKHVEELGRQISETANEANLIKESLANTLLSCGNLMEENETLSQNLSVVEEKAQQYLESNQELKKEIQELQSKIDEDKKRFENLESEHNKLQANFSQVNESSSSLHNDLNSRLEIITEKLSKEESKVQELRSENENLEKELTMLRQANDKLQQENKNSMSRYNIIQEENNKLLREHKEADAFLKEALVGLRKIKDNLDNLISNNVGGIGKIFQEMKRDIESSHASVSNSQKNVRQAIERSEQVLPPSLNRRNKRLQQTE